MVEREVDDRVSVGRGRPEPVRIGQVAVDVVAPCGKLVKAMELGAVEARFLGEFARDRLLVGLPVGMLADRELFES